MPDEQPYFMVKVTRCGECPYLLGRFTGYSFCSKTTPSGGQKAMTRSRENADGITPSCPLWAKVQTEPPKD